MPIDSLDDRLTRSGNVNQANLIASGHGRSATARRPGAWKQYGKKCRYFIFVTCFAALPLGAAYGLPFLQRLQLNVDPPPNSPAYRALKAFKAAFPLQAVATQSSYILLLTRPGGLPVLNTSSPSCTSGGRVTLPTRCPLVAPLDYFSAALEQWLNVRLNESGHPHWFNDTTLSSYHSFHAQNFSLLQSALLNSPGHPQTSNATILRIQVPLSTTLGLKGFQFTQDLAEKIDDIAEAAGGDSVLRVQMAGLPAFLKAAQDGVKHDIELMDTISFPLALAIFVAMLRNARLLLLPVLNIGVVVCTAFAIMYLVSCYMLVDNTVPSLMLSVSIATSIDYSLFLLSRFREEIEKRRSPARAVELMMSAAGHTVLVSGSTLAFCFAGLAAFPVQMFRTMGIGAGSTAALSVVVNLTLTPAMLLTFPRFFSTFEWGGLGCLRGCLGRCLGRTRSASTTNPLFASAVGAADGRPTSDMCTPTSDIGVYSAASDANGERLSGQSELKHAAAKRSRRCTVQCWSRIAGCTQRFSILTIALVLLAALPFIIKLPTLKTTADFALFTPRGAPCTVAYNQLISDFGSGAEAPYQLLLQPRGASGNVSNQAFFDDVNELVHWLSRRNGTRIGPLIAFPWLVSVTGIAVPDPFVSTGSAWAPLTYERYEKLNPSAQAFGEPIGSELKFLWSQQVSSVDRNRTMALGIRLPFDPFSDAGHTWLQDFRDAMAAAASGGAEGCACGDALSLHTMQLAGGGSGILDAISTVYASMPYVIATTFAAAFGVVLLAFRSVFVPLRAVLSIALTVAWVYGLLIWVYQEGGLSWTGVPSLQPTPAGISWIVPVITFAVLVGLGLDYDVFLLTRVYETRLGGASNSVAITTGLVRSGNVITAAGVIMAIAFTGLLLNTQPALNQMAMVLVSSVLLDTFVVRTVLLPAIMSLLGRYNWWPRKMPSPEMPDVPPSLGCTITCYELDVEMDDDGDRVVE